MYLDWQKIYKERNVCEVTEIASFNREKSKQVTKRIKKERSKKKLISVQGFPCSVKEMQNDVFPDKRYLIFNVV